MPRDERLFLGEQFDKYGNAPKYVIPSVVASLLVLNFKAPIFIQDSCVGFGIESIIFS